MNPAPPTLQWPVPCREDPTARTPSFVATAPTVCLGRDLLQALETHAGQTGKNVRFCLHPDAASSLQEMIILQHAGRYFPPKQHPHKAKSFKVLAGELAVFVFTAEGEVREAHRLTPDNSLVCRVGPGIYHADISLTPTAIHLETTTGPFHRESDRIVASWAPAGQDEAGCHRFRDRLLRHLSTAEGGASCISS